MIALEIVGLGVAVSGVLRKFDWGSCKTFMAS